MPEYAFPGPGTHTTVLIWPLGISPFVLSMYSEHNAILNAYQKDYRQQSCLEKNNTTAITVLEHGTRGGTNAWAHDLTLARQAF